MVTRLPSPSPDDQPAEHPDLDDDLPIEDTEPDDDATSVDVRFDIASYPADYTLRVLNEQIKEQQIVLPHFQRGYVWKGVQASRLIESFLLGLPVPEVFLYKSRQSDHMLVVDGQQRLGTIAAFYSGLFENNRAFLLRGVDSRWEGKKYVDLSDSDKVRLDNSTLRSIVIQQLDPKDHSSIYHTFERLNTGGTQLNAMEIRRVQFSRSAYPFLESLNDSDNWRTLIGAKSPNTRLKDVEMVLRVLAMATNRGAYSKPLKTFLNDFMASLEDMDQESKSSLRDSFVEACRHATEHLGQRPFHLHRSLNVAALDSVLGTLVEHPSSMPADLGTRFQDLTLDEDFLGAIERATSDEDSVKRRFARATAFLVK